MKVVVIHLEGRALQWHQDYVATKGADVFKDWNEYVKVLEAHFGNCVFDDPIAELTNLR